MPLFWHGLSQGRFTVLWMLEGSADSDPKTSIHTHTTAAVFIHSFTARKHFGDAPQGVCSSSTPSVILCAGVETLMWWCFIIECFEAVQSNTCGPRGVSLLYIPSSSFTYSNRVKHSTRVSGFPAIEAKSDALSSNMKLPSLVLPVMSNYILISAQVFMK